MGILSGCICSMYSQLPSRVLFLGNSYTSVNDLPGTFSALCNAMGKPMQVASNAPGGYTFNGHSTNATSLALIQQADWDVVVLQEQSQIPSFPPTQVASQCYPYAARLDSFIQAVNPCMETFFFMTWGRQNGDASNCANYPVLCTYDGMQGRLRESYLEMAQDNQASVSPVGMAWKRVRDLNPGIELYSPDGSHPSIAGTYLAACVFYASLFHESPQGAAFTSGLADSTAQILQLVAFETVTDSLIQWQGSGNWMSGSISGVVDQSNGEVIIQAESQHAGNIQWSLGDGSLASGQEVSHTYNQPGSYEVVATFDNGCRQLKDTLVLNLQWTSLPDEAEKNLPKKVWIENKTLHFETDGNCSLRIYTLDGRLWAENKNITTSGSISLKDWPSGLYVWELIYEEGKNITHRGIHVLSSH